MNRSSISSLVLCLISGVITVNVQGQSVFGIINHYAKVIDIKYCPPMVNVDTALSFSVGDLVLLMQMNGAMIDTSNTPSFGEVIDIRSAGLYEYGRIDSISNTEIYFEKEVVNNYDPTGAAVQLIRVPEYNDITVLGTVSCKPWNGTVGGVVTMMVYNTLTLNGNIDVSGKGFKGGVAVNVNWLCDQEDFYYATPDANGAEKGQGIGFVSASKRYGKGAPANGGGGGNSTNTGGGGGSLGGVGGHGGYQWGTNSSGCHGSDPSPETTPGRGGHDLSSYSQDRAFMGGGGGAGDANDFALSDGGTGGGIVMIKADTIISNNYVIRSNGSNGITPGANGNDGGGGGGAGGMIWINTTLLQGNISLHANGGKGADVRNHAGNHGPGGGAGGGIVKWPSSLLSPNVTIAYHAGASGLISNVTNPHPHGAVDGDTGLYLASTPFVFQTDSFNIVIYPSQAVTDTVCAYDTITLNPGTAAQVTWYPDSNLSCIQCQHPTVIVDSSNMEFWYHYTDSCGTVHENVVYVQIDSFGSLYSTPDTITACAGDTVTLVPITNAQVTWYPDSSLSCLNCQTPTTIVDTQGRSYKYYYVDGCGRNYENTVTVLTDTTGQYPTQSLNLVACEGDTLMLSPGTSAQVNWYPHPDLSCTQCQNPTVVVDSMDAAYRYYFTDNCGLFYEDTVSITVDTTGRYPSHLVVDTACAGDTILLVPGTSDSVTWYPNQGLSCTQCQHPTVIVDTMDRVYRYYYEDNCGLIYENEVHIHADTSGRYTSQPVSHTVCEGDTVMLLPGTNAPVTWYPHPDLSCTQCQSPVIIMDSTSEVYTYYYTDNCGVVYENTVTVNPDTLGRFPTHPLGEIACPGDTLTLVPGTNAQVTWYPHPNLSCTQCQNPVFTMDTVDTELWYYFEDNCGLVYEDRVVVLLDTTDRVYFTPDTVQACEGDSITVDPQTIINITWYPNQGLSCTSCLYPRFEVDSVNRDLTYYYINTCGELFENTITIEVDTNGRFPSTTVRDTACTGDTLVLLPGTNAQVTWYPDSALSCTQCQNPTIKVDSVNMEYRYYYHDSCGNIYEDAVEVITDTSGRFSTVTVTDTACAGDTIALMPGTNAQVSWYANPDLSCTQCQNPEVVVGNQDTVYRYYFTDYCGNVYEDEVAILVDTFGRYSSQPVSQKACEGEQIALHPGTNAQVTWYPNPDLSCLQCQNPTVTVDSLDAVYQYFYTDNCGIVYENEVVVVVDTAGRYPSTPVSDTACIGDTVVLQPGTNAQVEWEFMHNLSCLQCQNPSAFLDSTDQEFWYNYQDSCGNIYKNVVFISVDVTCYLDTPCTVIKLPNAFTPNGDGLNDEFKVLTDRPDDVTISSFRIYNRWGNLVFESNDLWETWDGTYRGEKAPVGVYAWVCKGECDKGPFLYYGNVTLIR